MGDTHCAAGCKMGLIDGESCGACGGTGVARIGMPDSQPPEDRQRLAEERARRAARGRWGYVLGRFIITTKPQPGHAPLADRCWTTAESNGKQYVGWAILLTPWRRNRYGESDPQLALVVGREVRLVKKQGPLEFLNDDVRERFAQGLVNEPLP